jgi:hypothetical protein
VCAAAGDRASDSQAAGYRYHRIRHSSQIGFEARYAASTRTLSVCMNPSHGHWYEYKSEQLEDQPDCQVVFGYLLCSQLLFCLVRVTQPRARNPRSPSPDIRGHPRFAGDRGLGHSDGGPIPDLGSTGDRGSIPIPIPDLPESGIQLSTIEYCKGVDFRLPQCLTLRLLIVQPIKACQ